jgi:hypothetical protein
MMMSKVNILVHEQYRDMLAVSLLQLAKLHKKECNGECGISLFPIREIVAQLLERPLTDDETRILS